MDALYALRSNLPGMITNNLPPDTDLTRASYWLLSIGLITAVPTVMSGTAQAYKMVAKQGMYQADGKTIKDKVKATIAHAVVNDISLFATAYVWWTRRQIAATTIAGKMGVGSVSTSSAAYAPATWMVAAEVVAMMLMFFGASIGGSLTYNYGIGFSAMSSGKKTQ